MDEGSYACPEGGEHCLDFFRVFSKCPEPKEFAICCKCGAESRLEAVASPSTHYCVLCGRMGPGREHECDRSQERYGKETTDGG